jgi:hypothetical protein
MKTLNLPEYYASDYTAANDPEVIHIEKGKFISIIGKGSFTEDIFYQRINLLKQAVLALIKLYKGSEQDFEMSFLEGLYWNDNRYGQHSISSTFDTGPLSELNYRLMIRIPEFITGENIARAKDSIEPMYKDFLKDIEPFEYQEGTCIQMLHIGPFVHEIKTLKKIEEFAEKRGVVKRGFHHEIYLVDFTMGGSQQHLKTILREPVNL